MDGELSYYTVPIGRKGRNRRKKRGGNMSVLKKMLLILILLVILAGLSWVGISIYANFIQSPAGASSTMPDIEKATYSVYIENTGNLILTDSYEHQGNIYILQGYFELVGQKWQYRKSELVLDEAIFGKITIERRLER